MLPPKAFLDTLSEQATRLLSQESPIAPAELEKQLKALLQSAFSKLDLVSREEFEGQMLVLARTRKRLEALEKQVQALEQQLEQNPAQ
ncbi:accessory factor UbiK family protein [Thiopseudomonas acetoxidans]|uniref:Ubiquinone biosynthesis accessory factor UbiK n=1 Tax=Thiopseudomonas acetoxidans TaxID=3041622 RepID=A0ABT7SQI8_9GAMM|nr:accessory factor UbiK family protein [Thiopseudomonas sp. CY1220]MDM7858441.1 accessory factor UbiK family protein [Thiopseudomonas sp. CY1220]